MSPKHAPIASKHRSYLSDAMMEHTANIFTKRFYRFGALFRVPIDRARTIFIVLLVVWALFSRCRGKTLFHGIIPTKTCTSTQQSPYLFDLALWFVCLFNRCVVVFHLSLLFISVSEIWNENWNTKERRMFSFNLRKIKKLDNYTDVR